MIGRKLSHYEVLESLGAGGMGEVYRARDTRLARDVAIKVLPPDRSGDETSRRRFQREAMAASSLNHPNIITIYEINTEGDTDFIVMEHVRGSTLSKRIKTGPLPIDEVVGYAGQIAEAVAKAHAAGIIHRDLKPGNVMITDDGLVKVLDFGLAKFDASSINTQSSGDHQIDMTLSLAGAVTGTIAYMSPEQARGERVDIRSDVFSFGIVFYEMLAGQLPFAGPNAMAILHNIHFSPPRPLLELRPDAPPGLAALLNRMLEKPPEQRPTMAEVASMLRAGSRATGTSAVTWRSGMPAADGVGDWASGPFSASAVSAGQIGAAQGQPKIGGLRLSRAVAALLLVVAVLGIGGYLLKRKVGASTAGVSPATVGHDVAVTDEPFALRSHAQAYLERWDVPDNLDRAITILNRALELDQAYAPAYASLTFAYFEKNRINPDPQWVKQAEQSAARSMQLNADLADSHLASGVAAMMGGHFAEAERAFRKAADIEPKSSKPHFWLGFLFNSNGNSKQAEQELDRALAMNPQDWRTEMNLGLLLFKGARYAEAADAWERASKLTPDNIVVLSNLAAAYHMVDRSNDAASALQRSLEIKPDADTYTNLGTIRFFQGHYAEAVPAFEKAVKLGANSYTIWGNLGDAYRWAPGQAAKAKPAYDNAIHLAREELKVNSQNLDAQSYLALYLAKSGDKKAALAQIAKVDAISQREAEMYFVSSVVHEVCGERDSALAALASSLKAGYALNEIKNDPELLSLRSDPRYLSILGNLSAK
jgi:eukaryotic-like serine/threonine-protein kinase